MGGSRDTFFMFVEMTPSWSRTEPTLGNLLISESHMWMIAATKQAGIQLLLVPAVFC